MSRQIIKIQQEENKPKVICPNCKEQIYVDLSPFMQDCSKIMVDKCPKCRGNIHVGILVLSHPFIVGIT